MSLFKKLLGPAAIYGLASQVGTLINVLILPIVSPYLVKADYGVVAVVMGYVSLLNVFQYLGLPIILTNAFFKHKDRYQYVFRSAMGFLHIWSFVYYAVVAVLLYLVCPPEARDNVWLIIGLICLPPIILGPVDTIGLLLFQLRRKPQMILFVTLITAVVSAGTSVYTIKYLKAGYIGFIYVFAAASITKKILMHLILTVREKMYPIWMVRLRHWRPRLKVSLPMVPHYYGAYLLNSSDRIVMDQLGVTTGSIGLYDGAGKFGGLCNAGGVAINKAIAPLMLEEYKKGNHAKAEYWGETFQLIMLAATYSAVMVLPEVFPFVIRSPGMEAAIPIAVPIIMAYNYRGMYATSTNILFYNETTKPLLKISLIAGVTNVVLNLVCIPLFGFEAAAWTTFVCCMYMGYSGFLISEYKEAVIDPVNWKFWLLLTCVLTIVANLMLNASFVYRLASIPVLFAALFIIYRLNNKF